MEEEEGRGGEGEEVKKREGVEGVRGDGRGKDEGRNEG